MSTNSATRSSVPPWALAVAAMLSVQLGSAVSMPLIETVGAAGTGWLRLTGRSHLPGIGPTVAAHGPPSRHPALLGLGITNGMVAVLFLAAMERIPLGTAVAIEFLGPSTVAAVRSHSARALVWPALAMTGVVLLSEPWQGDINPAGVGFAALSVCGWAAYILLTQRIGDRFSGLGGLTLTTPIAAAAAAIVGVPEAAGHLTPTVLAVSVGLALLYPVLPFALELLALRHYDAQRRSGR